MAIYPPAKYRPVSGLEKDPPIKPIGVILHVRDGLGDSLYPYFDGPSGGIESHMYLTYSGHWEQYRDTNREADANYHGNSFIQDGRRVGYVSVETEGLANGIWNDTQIRELKEFMIWCHLTLDIPLQVCKSPTSPGIGYHVMWGAPGPWTPANKTCPGPNRIAQFKNIITPWLSNPENQMELTDKFAVYNPQDGSRPEITVKEALRRASYVYNYMPILRNQINDFNAQRAAEAKLIMAAVQKGSALTPDDVQKALSEALSDFRLTLGPVPNDETDQ